MFNDFTSYFRKFFQKINSKEPDNFDELTSILQTALNDLINNFQSDLPEYKCSKIRTVSIKKLVNKFGYDFGSQRSRNICRIASWLFELPNHEKEALLTFLLIKEALLHFITISDFYPLFSESFVNIIILICMKNKELVKSFSNRTIRFINIRKRLLDKKINTWFIEKYSIIFVTGTSFTDVIDKYSNLLSQAEENSWTDEHLLNTFEEWIHNLYTIEDFVSPFYFQKRYIQIIKLMVKLGHENSSTSSLASNLNIHSNSARNYLTDITRMSRTWWLPIWNLNKFHLHPYFLLLKTDSLQKQKDVLNRLIQIPYMKTIYNSKEQSDSFVTLVYDICCPSSFFDILNNQFIRWQHENLITNYLFQQRNIYTTLNTFSSKKIALNFNNYRKLTTKLDDYIHQYRHAQEFETNPANHKDKLSISLDYNLLFFKSIYNFRGVIKATYFVSLDEFYELCEKNDISKSDHDSVMDFLNQLEIRARRRNLLDYSLVLSPVTSLDTVLTIEIPFSSSKELKKLNNLINKYFIFSLTTQHTLEDRVILMVRGGFTYRHPIFDYLKESLEQNGFDIKYYNVKWYISKPIPYHDLFDYENNNWIIK